MVCPRFPLVVVPVHTMAAVVDHLVCMAASLVVVVQAPVAVVVRVRTLDGQYVWVPLAQMSSMNNVVVPWARMVVPSARMVVPSAQVHLGSPH